MRLLAYFLILMTLSEGAFSRVRKIPVSGDQIVTVKTAIGIATIIQVPDRPNSVVVGDQESFKVEYLDQAITIKPLHSGAKSNLYVYTDWKRYNIQLTTGAEANADYVVYLDSPQVKNTKSNTINWYSFVSKVVNQNITLQSKRLGFLKNNLIAIEFIVTSSKKEKFDPSWIWLTQNGETKPIHNLFVSSLKLDEKNKINAVIQVLKSDLSLNAPLRIELRRNQTSYLRIPKVDSWKQIKALH